MRAWATFRPIWEQGGAVASWGVLNRIRKTKLLLFRLSIDSPQGSGENVQDAYTSLPDSVSLSSGDLLLSIWGPTPGVWVWPHTIRFGVVVGGETLLVLHLDSEPFAPSSPCHPSCRHISVFLRVYSRKRLKHTYVHPRTNINSQKQS